MMHWLWDTRPMGMAEYIDWGNSQSRWKRAWVALTLVYRDDPWNTTNERYVFRPWRWVKNLFNWGGG